MQNKPAILEAPAAPQAPAPSRWLNRCFWLLVLCALTLSLLLFRAEILPVLARAWVVNEPLGKADAILVLGGKVDSRPFAAAQLYREGRAPLVLVTQPKLTVTMEMGLAPAEYMVATQVLVKAGVPVEAIRLVGTNVTSTLDEAFALRALVTGTPLRSIIIPTDPFHTRRVRRIFSQTLRGTGSSVTVAAIEMKRYGVANWWTDEQGLADFHNELAKFVYYLLH